MYVNGTHLLVDISTAGLDISRMYTVADMIVCQCNRAYVALQELPQNNDVFTCECGTVRRCLPFSYFLS